MLLLYVSIIAAKINLLSVTTTKYVITVIIFMRFINRIGKEILWNLWNNSVFQISSHKINNILLSYIRTYCWSIYFNYLLFNMIMCLAYYSRHVFDLTNSDKCYGLMMRDFIVFVGSLSVSITWQRYRKLIHPILCILTFFEGLSVVRRLSS